jgi:hypothetical protein
LLELFNNIKDLKPITVAPNNFFRRPDNMNSLTLKSEYSEEKSEFNPPAPEKEKDKDAGKERRLFSPQKEQIIKSNHESFDELVSGLKVNNTEIERPMVSKKAIAKNRVSNLEEDIKIKYASNKNLSKQNPNKTLTSKDSRQSLEKNKKSTLFNKKSEKISPRNLVKKDSINRQTTLISSITAKPITIRNNKTSNIKKVMLDSTNITDKPKKRPEREASSSAIIKTSITQLTKNDKNDDLFLNDGLEYDKVSEEWMMSPMNKIPVRASKLLSDKNIMRNGYRSLPKYMNLKYCLF